MKVAFLKYASDNSLSHVVFLEYLWHAAEGGARGQCGPLLQGLPLNKKLFTPPPSKLHNVKKNKVTDSLQQKRYRLKMLQATLSKYLHLSPPLTDNDIRWNSLKSHSTQFQYFLKCCFQSLILWHKRNTTHIITFSYHSPVPSQVSFLTRAWRKTHKSTKLEHCQLW